MTNEQARALEKHWQTVSYYVVSGNEAHSKVISPCLHSFTLAKIWEKICQLNQPQAHLTFFTQKAKTN